jgi:hypothetical protein
MKGFGQQVQNQSYKSLYKQIELSVLGIKKQEPTKNVSIFMTSPKRKIFYLRLLMRLLKSTLTTVYEW